MMTLTIDEGLQDNPPGDSTGSEDDQQMDENIEMERIAKMNFYAFKSIDKEGIVGMCQDIKKNKSPNTKSQLPTRAESGMSSKYKSFLNKSVNDCGNLMISNSLLKPKDTNSTREQLHYIDVPFSKRPQL